jgi:hypothetical protein
MRGKFKRVLVKEDILKQTALIRRWVRHHMYKTDTELLNQSVIIPRDLLFDERKLSRLLEKYRKVLKFE